MAGPHLGPAEPRIVQINFEAGMDSSSPVQASSAPTGFGPWYRWRGYTVRWLLFGEIVQLFQPVADEPENFWELKFYQALTGLLFGLVCAAIFTVAENTFNARRVTWKTWLLVVATWAAVKVIFVSLAALSG